jgi:hypothetical protein
VLAWKSNYDKTIYKFKKSVTSKVSNAIRSGKLERQDCEICGKKAQAHHEDYSKPLDVIWLCTEHHSLRHKEINEERRRNEKKEKQ